MGELKTILSSVGKLFRHKENVKEEIIIRIKEGRQAGMKLEYGWSIRPLTDFPDSFKEAELPSTVKVIIDVPEDADEKEIKIAPIGKKIFVKIPGRRSKEIDLPYAVENEYMTSLENNVLFIFLRRKEDG